MKTTFLISSFLTFFSGILLIPTNAKADEMVKCILAHNQGVITPNCAKMLGLTTPASKKEPSDNGGIHLKSTLHYQPPPASLATNSIVGLTLGMSITDATNAMKTYCKDSPHITYTFLEMNYKGVHTKTQFYPHILQCNLGDDNIEVHISPPVIGNIVTEINRNASFKADTSPRFTELKTDIDNKYGVNLLPLTERKSSSEVTIDADANGTITTLPKRSFISVSDETSYNVPGEIAYLTIVIDAVNNNPSNVSRFSLKLEDLRAKRNINNEVMKQLKASVDDRLKNNTIKPAL